MDGRRFRPSMDLVLKPQGGVFALHAPRPGIVRGLPALGTTLAAGAIVGELDVLGVLHALVIPQGAAGAITAAVTGKRSKVAVAAGEQVLLLDPAALAAGAGVSAASVAAAGESGLVFRTPLGGRYYARPSPGEPPFVAVGQVIEVGQTVALLEVMKTFNRVRYAAGAGLPERAKVLRVIPNEGDDLMSGAAILELEAV